MIPLTNKELRSYASKTNCHICKKKFEDKCTDHRNIIKLEIIVIIQINTEVLHITHVILDIKYLTNLKMSWQVSVTKFNE